MVVLNKIYTRTGDGGDTALGDGSRRAKHNLRVSAYGTSDETNATVGLARLHAEGEMDEALARIAELRYLAGLSLKEIAETLETSVRTAERRLKVANTWLRDRLRTD